MQVNKWDICAKGGGHKYEIEYENIDIQILRCMKCGKASIGYLNPKFKFLVEEQDDQ